ncbi:uncharacterized protein LOC143736783 [Siphateles boraxobius]|uniref:uncharacterized protein LOC143736783 n=1 Tax=Siphateles boraxobius TaxID=180520 RepID=UPI0040631AA4
MAIIGSLADSAYIVNLFVTYGGDEAWIGLNRNLWLWSDQTSVSWLSVKWSSGEPDNGDGNRKCAFVYKTGLIGDEELSERLPFFCNKRSQMQLVRMAVRSAGSLDEAAVTTAVEEKIQQILSEQEELDAGSSVTWRVQADGKIFQLQENNTRNKTSAVCSRDNPHP